MLLQHLFPQNNNNNIHSHHISTSTTPMEWNHCSGPTTKSTTTTQNMKNEPLEEGEDSDQHIRLVPKQVSLPVKIAGIGRYLPPYIVPSSTIDILCGKPKGFTEKTTGIKERRWANSVQHVLKVRKQKFAKNVEQFLSKEEMNITSSSKQAQELKEKEVTISWMGAQAALEALKNAEMTTDDIDLIVNASGTPQRTIPDTSCFLHKELGLSESGKPSLSIHSTCLSFMSAFHMCAGLIASGMYQTILIVSAEISTVGLNFEENPHAGGLIGDGAAAVVLTRSKPGEKSRLSKYLFSTYSDGADYTSIRSGGSEFHPNHVYTPSNYMYFDMNGKKILEFTASRMIRVMEDYQPGLSSGNLEGIDWVVPHQASYAAFHVMSDVLGWPSEKIVKTLEKFGNTISASIPMALYEGIHDGRIKRGDNVFMIGTGAGLTTGMITFTY
nr:unnamed protein product [Naegleria fowleri]